MCTCEDDMSALRMPLDLSAAGLPAATSCDSGTVALACLALQ